MAKGNGGTRNSTPGNPKGLADISYDSNTNTNTEKRLGIIREYKVNGERYDYGELTRNFPEQAKIVRNKLKEVSSEMNKNLIGKKVNQVIDNDKPISIEFSSKNNQEFARQAMLTLSGKYFTRREMTRIDKILSKAEYVPSNHINTHNPEDKNTYWFTYKDITRKNIWFKVKRDMSGGGKYYLYSVTDKRE